MASSRRREASIENAQYDRHFAGDDIFGGQVRHHRVGMRTFQDGGVTTNLRGMHFASGGVADARAVHLDGTGQTLTQIKTELTRRGIRKKGDRIHEVRMASGGGGIFVLLSPAPLNPEASQNVDFDGQDD
ncbi:MAG: hypothetical protein ACOY3M_02145 [Patescibacteria group bacterium]